VSAKTLFPLLFPYLQSDVTYTEVPRRNGQTSAARSTGNLEQKKSTFVYHKFSLLIRLSYAEFGLSYTAGEQIFRVSAQRRSTTESRTVFCVYKMPDKADSSGRAV
jgi:hypothetical protein